MRRLLVFALKVCVSLTLLGLALRNVEFAAIRERLGDLSLPWIALVIAVLAGQIVTQAIRWRLIAVEAGAAMTSAVSVRISFIAAFFNQTLPSTIGGDAARIWLLAQAGRAGWKAAAYSVFLDRAVGVFFLAVLVLATLPWTFAYVASPAGRLAVAAIGAAGVIGGIVFAALSYAKGTRLEKLWPVHHLAAAADILMRMMRRPREAVVVTALSLGIHLLTVFVAWAAARAIAGRLDFLLALCLMPPVVLLSTIPVSIAGWGVRETLMITGFNLAGLNTSDALLISVLLGVANFLVGAGGGLAWIAIRNTNETLPAGEPVMSAGNRPRSG